MRVLVVFAVLGVAPIVHADDRAIAVSTGSSDAAEVEAHAAAPVHAFTYSAEGTPVGTVGAATTGSWIAGRGDASTWGVGGRAFGAPLRWLTLVGEAERSLAGTFIPSAAALILLYRTESFVFSTLVKGKAQGFSGPEVEGEAELGLLLGVHRGSFHFDANAMAGAGLGDEREMDGEARLRLGIDIHPHARVGFDSIARFRVVGDRRLPGDRVWDFSAGPQLLGSWKRFFASLTAGPTTVSRSAKGVGWLANVSLGVSL